MAIPDQRGRDFAKAENEIVGSIFIEVGHDCAGLFGGWTRDWKIACGAGKMLPTRRCRMSRESEKNQDWKGQ
jgi:hypothetical protein